MLRLLTPDLDATEEIDLGAEHYRRETGFYERHLEEARARQKAPEDLAANVQALEGLIADMRLQEADYLGAPDTEHIYATIGYIPAPAISAIRHGLAKAHGKDEDELYAGSLDANRQTVRWGLRAWRGPDVQDIPTEQETVHGRRRPVAAWVAVDAIEAAGLLSTLAACIWDYNDLSAEKKTRSSDAPGSTTTSSGAPTASLSQAVTST